MLAGVRSSPTSSRNSVSRLPWRQRGCSAARLKSKESSGLHLDRTAWLNMVVDHRSSLQPPLPMNRLSRLLCLLGALLASSGIFHTLSILRATTRPWLTRRSPSQQAVRIFWQGKLGVSVHFLSAIGCPAVLFLGRLNRLSLHVCRRVLRSHLRRAK